MTEQHALGFEITRAELALVIEDIRLTLNVPPPMRGDAPPPDIAHREEWNEWWSSRRQRFLQADPRYRLLERRHGPDVVAQTDADYLTLGERMVQRLIAEQKTRTDEDWAETVRREMPESLPITEGYDIEDLLLLQEIAADAERVAEHRDADERLQRDFEDGSYDPKALRTYRDLADAIMHLYGHYEGEGHDRDCGFEFEGDQAEPNSDAAQEAWHDHLWNHVFSDQRFVALAAYWDVDTVQEALRRHNEFELAWMQRVMLPNMRAHKEARERGEEVQHTEQQMQRTAREHTTLRRMLASDIGLTEDLPEP